MKINVKDLTMRATVDELLGEWSDRDKVDLKFENRDTLAGYYYAFTPCHALLYCAPDGHWYRWQAENRVWHNEQKWCELEANGSARMFTILPPENLRQEGRLPENREEKDKSGSDEPNQQTAKENENRNDIFKKEGTDDALLQLKSYYQGITVFEGSFQACNLKLESLWFEDDPNQKDNDWICLCMDFSVADGTRVPFDTVIALDYLPDLFAEIDPMDLIDGIELGDGSGASYPAVTVVKGGTNGGAKIIRCKRRVRQLSGNYGIYAARKGHFNIFRSALSDYLTEEASRLKNINTTMYGSIIPSTNIPYFNSLTEYQQYEYLEDLPAYYDLFLQYLINHTRIKTYEDELKENKDCLIPIGSVPDDYQDLYQYLCNYRLSYFYIRNNIYIERLNHEEIQLLRALKELHTYNEQIDSFIENTFRRVIPESMDESLKETKTYFGPASQDFLVQNGSLVIGARFFDDKIVFYHLNEDEKKNTYDKMRSVMNEKCKKLEAELCEFFELPVRVIQYTEQQVASDPGEYFRCYGNELR